MESLAGSMLSIMLVPVTKMLSIVFFILILPIILCYGGCFLEWLVDNNTSYDDWYRTPTRMLIFIFTIVLSCLSLTFGIIKFSEYFNIPLR